MNIGFLYLHAPYESMGSIYRVRNFCKGLAELGHNCYIFTPYDYNLNWGPKAKFIKIKTSKVFNKLSNVLYIIIRKILNNSYFSNFILFNSFIFNSLISRTSKGLLKLLKKRSLNLDILIGETEIAGFILIQTKEKINFPIIIDYQNFWPEELIENKIINRNSKTYNFLMSKERQIIKKADFIITPSEELKKYLIKRFKIHDDARIEKVVNGGNPILKTPLNKHFPPKIINAGMVVKRSNMQLFLNSIPYIIKKYPKAEIYITKKGEDLKKIMKLIKKMDLNSNIRFYWEDTYQEFLKFLAKCHVGVVTSTYNLTRRLGFVTKIYDYFAVGVPVVGNGVGGWTSIISEEKLGLLSSNDPHDLAEKIVKVIENDQLGKEFGKAAIEILKTKYSIESSAKSLIKVINKCI